MVGLVALLRLPDALRRLPGPPGLRLPSAAGMPRGLSETARSERSLLVAAVLVAAFLVSKSCGSSENAVSQERAKEIARAAVDFEPDRVGIRYLKRGFQSRGYWAVSLSRRKRGRRARADDRRRRRRTDREDRGDPEGKRLATRCGVPVRPRAANPAPTQAKPAPSRASDGCPTFSRISVLASLSSCGLGGLADGFVGARFPVRASHGGGSRCEGDARLADPHRAVLLLHRRDHVADPRRLHGVRGRASRDARTSCRRR